MKKQLTLVYIFFAFSFYAKCQNLIIKNNNDSVKVEIVEIKANSILCLRLEKPKLYIKIRKSDIKYILPLSADSNGKLSVAPLAENTETAAKNNTNNYNFKSGDYFRKAGNNLILGQTLSIFGAVGFAINMSTVSPDPKATVLTVAMQVVAILLNYSAAVKLANAGALLKQEQQQFILKDEVKNSK
ncbi:MAG: hypothetical protein ACEQSR_05380 [Candidatus Methylacidiphilales bacterium]